jgi:hypothetical protein
VIVRFDLADDLRTLALPRAALRLPRTVAGLGWLSPVDGQPKDVMMKIRQSVATVTFLFTVFPLLLYQNHLPLFTFCHSSSTPTRHALI